MFADETTILVRGPSVTSRSTQLNEVARTVSTWADNNRMSLNTTKTKSLLIYDPAETPYFNQLGTQCPNRW